MQFPYFRRSLLDWNALENTRKMPWKGEKDPYKVWLSEVILQQTRVEQGLAYYERFLEAFPRVEDLAGAEEDHIFKYWEGLGYYSRCKNLIHTAKFIAGERQGRFPDTYEGILALRGVGSYTAAAIASFAYGLPHAVVDGNVLRVLSRFFGVREPVDSTGGRALLNDLAAKCLERDAPGVYNQAIMDFGAVVCKPVAPACGGCPLRTDCVALREGAVELLPVKSKRTVRRPRRFVYLVAEYKGGVYVRKRTGKDIWQNLFEFILHELNDENEWNDYGALLGDASYTVLGRSPWYRQLLTHQEVRASFVRIRLQKPLHVPGFTRAPKEELEKLAFPRLLNDYLHAPLRAPELF